MFNTIAFVLKGSANSIAHYCRSKITDMRSIVHSWSATIHSNRRHSTNRCLDDSGLFSWVKFLFFAGKRIVEEKGCHIININ